MTQTAEPIKLSKEFPDFPVADYPTLPEGFADSSWHNDACPSMKIAGAAETSEEADDILATAPRSENRTAAFGAAPSRARPRGVGLSRRSTGNL